MVIRVLVVDDSRFICKRIQEILEQDADFKVIGFAANGKDAVLKTTQLKPDVITMDIEMPIMDGISAVKKIMADCPTAILMFSAATHAGAKATLDALNAGAVDFLPKQLDQIDGNRETAKQLLRNRVRALALQSNSTPTKIFRPQQDFKLKLENKAIQARHDKVDLLIQRADIKKIDLLVIVASTGGPVAIQKVLTELSANCSFPIIIVQHMPHNFTKSFAERLNQLCQISVKEAVHGDLLKAGAAYLGPGGMQMEIKSQQGMNKIHIREKQEGEIYGPCADITLASVSNIQTTHVLTVVLTGMGADGAKGAKKLKQKGAKIWAQDEASCTIYGMPKAIVDAHIADKVLSLNDIANEFKQMN